MEFTTESKTKKSSTSKSRPAPGSDRNCSDSLEQWREKQVRSYVLLVMVKVLKKSGALREMKKETWMIHIARLVTQVIEAVEQKKMWKKGNGPKLRLAKYFARDVMRHLEKKHPNQVKELILAEDPEVEATMIRYIQDHIEDQCGGTWQQIIIVMVGMKKLFLRTFGSYLFLITAILVLSAIFQFFPT